MQTTSMPSQQPIVNGRPLEKQQQTIQLPNVPNGRLMNFTKPTKLNHEIVPPNHQQPPATPTSGKDVEIILKMMTSTVDPLSQIAATPRNEIIEMHPQRQHKYLNDLPPLFKPPIKPCRFYNKNFESLFFLFFYLMFHLVFIFCYAF